MDVKRLKGRLPFPFETLAVAVAFSPRLEAILAEANRLARMFKAKLLLIHIGPKTSEKIKLLEEICGRVGLNDQEEVIWRTGDTVATLLRTCKENVVDLLILGALRREKIFRYYRGSVARGLSRKAKCSLLLLPEPRVDGTGFSSIIVDCVDHPKTQATLDTAIYFGCNAGSRRIYLVKEVDSAGLAMTMSEDRTTTEREVVRQQLLQEAKENVLHRRTGCRAGAMEMLDTVLLGRPGFMIRKFAEENRADLLAIHSPDSSYGLMDRIFTHDMGYILEHLPCSVLIVHSRPANGS